jgi:hypothetical protein
MILVDLLPKLPFPADWECSQRHGSHHFHCSVIHYSSGVDKSHETEKTFSVRPLNDEMESFVIVMGIIDTRLRLKDDQADFSGTANPSVLIFDGNPPWSTPKRQSIATLWTISLQIRGVVYS